MCNLSAARDTSKEEDERHLKVQKGILYSSINRLQKNATASQAEFGIQTYPSAVQFDYRHGPRLEDAMVLGLPNNKHEMIRFSDVGGKRFGGYGAGDLLKTGRLQVSKQSLQLETGQPGDAYGL